MDRARLAHLLDLYVDEALPPAEKAELETMLLASAEARQIFWQRVGFHATLREAGEQVWGQRAASTPDSGKVVAFPLWRKIALAAAACVLIGGLAWSWAFRGTNEPLTDGVAVLGSTVQAVWEDGVVRETGAIFAPGWLKLKSGFAQVEFVSGARVILEGPVEFQLINALEGFCQSGRLNAEVPQQAQGFKVGSPKATVVDLGTAFGLEVEKDGSAELHVLEGAVELHRATEFVSLHAGQSVRVGADGSLGEFNETVPDYLNTAMLESRAANVGRARYQAWAINSRQIAALPGLAAYFTFESGAAWGRTLPNFSQTSLRSPDGSIVGCTWKEGRWPGKGALEFRAIADRVRFGIPGQLDSFTYVAWVRLEALDHMWNSLIMCDGFEAGDAHWQINRNGRIILGVRGAKSGRDYVSPVVFTPDRLSKWIHLAVVFDRTNHRVAHFVNGQQVSGETLRPETDFPMRLEHAELGNWTPQENRDTRPIRNFQGRMDEVLIFNRPLPAEEIAGLHRSGQGQF